MRVDEPGPKILDVGHQEPLSARIPGQAVGLRSHDDFLDHVPRRHVDDEHLPCAPGCREGQLLLLRAQYPTRFRTVRNRAMVGAAVPIDDLHRPHRGMGDEHAASGQMDVSVIEPARRMGRQIY